MSFEGLYQQDALLQPQADEVDDEISLCNFPISSDAAADVNEQDLSDQEFFEFFTEDVISPAENMIFCGKVFSNKEEKGTENSQQLDGATKQNRSKKKTLFRWISNKSSGNHSSSFNASTKHADKSDVSLQKATKLAAPIKSDKKYYTTMLGLTSLPTAMQLKDIKTRQSRLSPTTIYGLYERSEMVKINRGGGRWLWRLLKALGVGCKSGHANAVVKATFGCL